MAHPGDLELIEFTSGHLPAGRRSAVEAHLAGCAACRQRHSDVAETWQVLGLWEVSDSARDRSAAVVAAARAARKRSEPTWRRHLAGALRFAAALVLSLGLGYGAGRLARPGSGPSDAGPPVIAPADAGAAAEALSLHVLEAGSPAGLAESLLANPAPWDDEES